ncbi:MAG TPA: hypothetical protein VF174_14530 [Micromonosporaceae bacterium]
MTRDVGDGHPIRLEVRDPDTGDLVSATVALKVIDPDDNETTPTPSSDTTGVYEYTIDLDKAGLWRWVWTVTGTVQDVQYGDVWAQDPAPGLYASVPDLRREMGISDGGSDDQLAAALASVSRDIDDTCGVPPGAFRPATAATARVFEPRDPCLVYVDPFWTAADLVVATDDGGDDTYSTVWSTSDYQLEPLNAAAYGKPYTAIRARTRRFPCRRASVQVTARWGWPTVPDPVRQACLMLAAMAAKLTAEAPFGVAGFDQFGAVRVRDNPIARGMLAPYQRWPVLLA